VVRKRISAAAAKAKGRRFQQEIAKIISDMIGLEYGPDSPVSSRGMGQSGVDIVLIGEAIKLFPFSIEAKNQEKFSLPAWIRQAETNILPNTDWLLVFKKNRFKPVVCFDLNIKSKYLLSDPNIYYNKKAWRIDNWINQAREKYKDGWMIELERQDRSNIILMDMHYFFWYMENSCNI